MEWNKTVWESSLDLGLRTLRLGVETHAITSQFALPLLIRTQGGLVVEVNDGTAEYNALNYRVSFFYDPAKAAVTRMAFALAHELRPTAGPPCHSRRAGCARRRCSRPSASSSRTGMTRPRECRTSRSPRLPRSWVGPSWRSPEIRMFRAGAGSRCPAGNSPGCTGSPISTAASPMPGGTSPKSRTPASQPMSVATAEPPRLERPRSGVPAEAWSTSALQSRRGKPANATSPEARRASWLKPRSR